MAGGLGTRSREESGELALALVECGTGKSRSARLRLVPMHSLLPLPFLLPLSFSLPLSPSPFSSSSLLTFLLQTRLYVYASLSNPSVLRCTDQPRASTRAHSLSLSLFPSPLYLLALSLFTCLVSSPIARSIPSTEIHRDSFGILPFLSSPFPPFFFLLSFELSRLEKEKRNVSFISFLYPAIFDRESLAII